MHMYTYGAQLPCAMLRCTAGSYGNLNKRFQNLNHNLGFAMQGCAGPSDTEMRHDEAVSRIRDRWVGGWIGGCKKTEGK